MTLPKFWLLTLAGCSLLLAGCKKSDYLNNKVPVVQAGDSKTTTLPADSVTLTGSATDEDGKVVAFLWSQVSGPAASTIVNPGAASTVVKGLLQGTYVFQLMATDDEGATGVDTAVVVVYPAAIKTLTLQPSNNPLEIQIGLYNGQNETYGGTPDLPIAQWTRSGLPLTVRAVIKFDLSSIPSNATIISANLYLYSYPSPTLNGNFVDANYGTDNSMILKQVTSNWSPGSISWQNQPITTTTNQVVIPHTSQSTLDLNLNTTAMVSSMVAGNANYGFFFKLQNEVAYNSRIIVSSYNTTYTNKHPKLVVVYQ